MAPLQVPPSPPVSVKHPLRGMAEAALLLRAVERSTVYLMRALFGASLAYSPLEGHACWSLQAVERGPSQDARVPEHSPTCVLPISLFYRARSASKKDTWSLPSHPSRAHAPEPIKARCPCTTPSKLAVISQGWGLIDLPLCASNEGSPRPRVARAQKIISLHPLLCSVSRRTARPPFPPYLSSCLSATNIPMVYIDGRLNLLARPSVSIGYAHK